MSTGDADQAEQPDQPDTPDEPDTATPTWGLGDAAGSFAAALAFSILLGGLAFAIAGGNDGALGVQLAGLAGLWIGLAGGPALASRLKGSGSVGRDFGFSVVPRRDIVPGALVGIGCQLLLVPLIFLPFKLLAPDLDLGDQARDLTGDAVGITFAIKCVVFVAIAPIVEELFFRGLVLRSLRRRMGALGAIVMSAIWFGLAHYSAGSAGAFLALFLALVAFGAVLATLAERTGRLGMSLCAHAAFNAVTMALIAFG